MSILLVAFVFAPTVLIFQFLGSKSALSIASSIYYASSILLFHWYLSNVIIASKVPFFQHHLPQDQKVRFHILSSAGIALCLLYHALFKISSGKQIDLFSWTLLVATIILLITAYFWKSKNGKGYDKSKRLHRTIVCKTPMISFSQNLDSLCFCHGFSKNSSNSRVRISASNSCKPIPYKA